MAFFKNAELRHGRNVIRTHVNVDAFVPTTGPSAGRLQWSGVLMPPNNTGLIKDQTYVLIIPGHSSVKIQVTDEANSVDGSVPFVGIGDWPKRNVTS